MNEPDHSDTLRRAPDTPAPQGDSVAKRGGTRDDSPGGVWGPIVVVVALVAAIVTFLVLMGVFNIAPRQYGIVALLVFDALLVLLLVGMVGRKLWRLRRETLENIAGARLHRRVVGLFSLVAAVPTALVAGAALIALERGLTPWFSGDLRALVQNAEVISQNFQQQICQNLGREMRLMAADVDRANSSGFFYGNQSGFQSFMNGRATALGFPHAEIFKEDGSMVLRAEVKSEREITVSRPTADDFRDARTDEPPCLLSSSSIGGLIRLTSFGPDTFLMVARGMDPRALEFPVVARSGVLQYQTLEARRNDAQLGIALVFALVVLIALLGSVLLGLSFADRLVDPIRRLMQATDQVSSGNLYVQVPVQKMTSDLSQLGVTFNSMTTALREQHDNLRAANELIDQRRQFMEAVLAGVPAGVIGVDADGELTLVNPTALQILGLNESDVTGHALAQVLPEIAGFIGEARRSPGRIAQTEIQMRRRGVERILSVRATEDAAGGTVITLDDITNLVTAQRSAAWADVARRIAHEIKNPLTPIQLSAERIRRKFGKVITEDRAIFDQCTDTIIRQVEDIKRMVDEFSSFARMPKPQPVNEDLVEVVKEVAFMMRVGNPGVTFDEALSENPVIARIDRRLVAQALQNLMKNACEAIQESPAGAEGRGRVLLALAGTEAGAVLDITDNGKGFPKENRQSLLEPYVTTRDGGTGLGLPIVAKIFEDHGGGIELLDPLPDADGLVPPGARVRIHLPPPGLAPDPAPKT
jgi:two-component system, NtrC family, nitrogen regulation sensor histidine kinase NtrY